MTIISWGCNGLQYPQIKSTLPENLVFALNLIMMEEDLLKEAPEHFISMMKKRVLAGSSTPSPGAQNSGFDAVECVACTPVSEGIIVINELVPDEDGTDSAEELSFVELRGTPGLCLSDLTLEHVNGTSTGNTLGSFELVGDMPADGYFVVGETDVSNLDQDVNMDLQGGPDNLLLLEGEVVIDAVAYGSFDVETMKKTLNAAKMERINLQAAVFEPGALRMHVSFNRNPAAAGPYTLFDVRALCADE